jgi:hypothetical protein
MGAGPFIHISIYEPKAHFNNASLRQLSQASPSHFCDKSPPLAKACDMTLRLPCLAQGHKFGGDTKRMKHRIKFETL